MERRSSLAGTTEWRSTALFSIRDSSLARVKGRFNGTHKDSTQADSRTTGGGNRRETTFHSRRAAGNIPYLARWPRILRAGLSVASRTRPPTGAHLKSNCEIHAETRSSRSHQCVVHCLDRSRIFCAGIFFLSGPVTEWVGQAPEISRKIQNKLAVLRSPVNAVVQASEQVGNIADSASATDVQKVVIQQPGMLSIAAASAFGGITTAGVTFVLLLFLLSSGTMFYQKIISILPTLTDKKRALTIAYDVEREVSQYLSTITLINCGFGAAVAVAMALTGMPNPVLWGVAAALLNFVPYIGALGGIVMVGMVALISFIPWAMLSFLLCCTPHVHLSRDNSSLQFSLEDGLNSIPWQFSSVLHCGAGSGELLAQL